MDMFTCERCGEEYPIEAAWNVESEHFGHIAVCDDCYGNLFEEHANREITPTDILEELEFKLSELKDVRLLRDEELITLLQSAVYEIKGLRSFKESVSAALNSGNGTYRP